MGDELIVSPGGGKAGQGSTDLTGVFINSGVNDQGEGFCAVQATSATGTILHGQLTPTEVRRMALDWLESAEAAEQDAAVLRVVRNLDLPDNFAGAVITELREHRADD